MPPSANFVFGFGTGANFRADDKIRIVRKRFIHLDKVELDIEILPGASRGLRQLRVQTPPDVVRSVHICSCFTVT